MFAAQPNGNIGGAAAMPGYGLGPPAGYDNIGGDDSEDEKMDNFEHMKGSGNANNNKFSDGDLNGIFDTNPMTTGTPGGSVFDEPER